jgi:oxygen-independent coproporphyrinogen-3 oxidase
MNKALIRKYNVPGPRYTSYPAVPSWDQAPPTAVAWKQQVFDTFTTTNTSDGISLYIHLPYCESLCTYCGCNTRITVNHQVEEPYIEAVIREWQMYLVVFQTKPNIAEIHLGGGTPTFFSPENLRLLINGIKSHANVLPDAVLGFEAHPNSTSKEHLEILYALGFTRLSLGIQDFDHEVQSIVNRVQTFETVKSVVDSARAIGYTSINFDLIYGLPLQTIVTVKDTIEKTALLKPDRIAFYSYAHVPWVKPGQRKFTELDLPEGDEKRALYELGKEMFEAIGYLEIGMDHFSLPNDDLNIAMENGKLHRNFMGYTPKHSQLMVGLGVSSISDSWGMFAQNVKTVEAYIGIINEGVLPIFKGHKLSVEDKVTRKQILDLMCQLETSWHPSNDRALIESKLSTMEAEGLLIIDDYGVIITMEGKPFVRNVCMAFDTKLWAVDADKEVFSKTV